MVLQDLRTWYAPHLESLQFNDMIAECKKILVGMVKILKNKVVEVVEDPKPEPEVDKPELGPEIVAELVSLQEEISSRPMKVVELYVKTLVDLPTKPTMKLVPSLAAMRASLLLRSPDLYDPLQIFLQETSSQEISALACG